MAGIVCYWCRRLQSSRSSRFCCPDSEAYGYHRKRCSDCDAPIGPANPEQESRYENLRQWEKMWTCICWNHYQGIPVKRMNSQLSVVTFRLPKELDAKAAKNALYEWLMDRLGGREHRPVVLREMSLTIGSPRPFRPKEG